MGSRTHPDGEDQRCVVRQLDHHSREHHLAVGETVILLHPPLPLAGVSIGMERERQQNDSLAGTASITVIRPEPPRNEAIPTTAYIPCAPPGPHTQHASSRETPRLIYVDLGCCLFTAFPLVLVLSFHCLALVLVLSFHCLSLSFHCLSLSFHCLSLSFCCLFAATGVRVTHWVRNRTVSSRPPVNRRPVVRVGDCQQRFGHAPPQSGGR